MQLRFLFSALLGAGALSAAHAQAWTLVQEQQANQLMSQVVPSQAPSAAVTVAINGRIVYGHGFGSVAPGVPANINTVYRIGSLSKQFTAAGVLQLAEQGKLFLDSNVSTYVPVASWTTLRHLLNMDSGLPNFVALPTPLVYPLDLNPYVASTVAAADILRDLAWLGPVGPGQFDYSNSNYFVLATVLEIVSGLDYRAYLREHVFFPAGLTATGFSTELPCCHVVAPPNFRTAPEFNLTDWPKGSGDMVSTAADFANWDAALMSGRVIGSAALDAMLYPAVAMPGTNPPAAYAMGEFVQQYPTYVQYTHTGEIAGYSAANTMLVTTGGTLITATILTNGDYVNGLDTLASRLAHVALTY